jgi:hypothetical protein
MFHNETNHTKCKFELHSAGTNASSSCFVTPQILQSKPEHSLLFRFLEVFPIDPNTSYIVGQCFVMYQDYIPFHPILLTTSSMCVVLFMDIYNTHKHTLKLKGCEYILHFNITFGTKYILHCTVTFRGKYILYCNVTFGSKYIIHCNVTFRSKYIVRCKVISRSKYILLLGVNVY